MDIRVNKFIFKDFKRDLIVYVIGMSIYLIIGKILKSLGFIEIITGGELVGGSIITFINIGIIGSALIFLKGNNILRKDIWRGLVLQAIIVALINSLGNLIINKIFNTTPFIYMITGQIDVFKGVLTSFCITILMIKIMWIFLFLWYRCKDSIIKWGSALVISLIVIDKTQSFLLEYRFTLNSWHIFILGSIGIISLINFYFIKKFEINGGIEER